MNGPPQSAVGRSAATTVDELARQHRILAREAVPRLVLTWLAFALSAVYLDPLLVFALALIDTVAELVNLRLMAGLDPSRNRRRYQVTVLCVIAMEGSFALAAGMVWQVDDPYAKAFAAGMVLITILQLTTVRSIHLPYALAGIATVAAVSFGANLIHWLSIGNWSGLVISSLSLGGAIAYALVAMNSNHLLQRQSAEGQAVAMAANAAKDRLMATISHELRTPLNGILGMGHLELAAAQSPEACARLKVLVGAAEGLSVLLDDILDISAARDGRLAIRPAVAVPADEIAAAFALFDHRSQDEGGHITLDIAPELAQPACFDRQRLRQCLSNLVFNALRHGQGAAIRVWAERTAGPSGQAQLQLTVADDGPGIPETLHDVLFEPFTRHHAPVPDGTRQGQGLGLSIARSLARAMGGDVVLLPGGALGRGAVFRLTLDIAPVPTGAPMPAPAILTDLSQATGHAILRVLVVDDIATNRMVAVGCLQIAGAEGHEVQDGGSALEMLTKSAFDAVLLDVNMPGLDGPDTLSRIRALDGPAARVKVIAMTADTGDTRSAHYLAAGFDGYLSKPVTPESVAAALTSVIRGRPDVAA